MSKVRALACAALLTCALLPNAHAGNHSPLTLGVGTGVGVLHAGQPDELATSTFVNQANVRLKALWLLGVDMSADLTHDPGLTQPDEALQFAAKLRMTGLLYAIPTEKVGLYLGVGVGGNDVGELFTVTGDGNSYHAGLGLEVNLTEHFSVDASFYVVIPGVRSIERHVERLALSSVEGAPGGAGWAGATDLSPTSEEATVGDFVNLRNFELMIRVFLFL